MTIKAYNSRNNKSITGAKANAKGHAFEDLVFNRLEKMEREGLIVDFFQLKPEWARKAYLNKDWGMMKDLKRVKGFADFIVFLKGGRVVFLELKTGTSAEKPQQKLKRNKMQSVGYDWLVCRDNLDELEKLLETN